MRHEKQREKRHQPGSDFHGRILEQETEDKGGTAERKRPQERNKPGLDVGRTLRLILTGVSCFCLFSLLFGAALLIAGRTPGLKGPVHQRVGVQENGDDKGADDGGLQKAHGL